MDDPTDIAGKTEQDPLEGVESKENAERRVWTAQTTYSAPQFPLFSDELPDEILEEAPAWEEAKGEKRPEKPEGASEAHPVDGSEEFRQIDSTEDGKENEGGLERLDGKEDGEKADAMEKMDEAEIVKESILEEVEGRRDEHSGDSNSARNGSLPGTKVEEVGIDPMEQKERGQGMEGDRRVADPADGMEKLEEKREDGSEGMEKREGNTGEKENLDDEPKRKRKRPKINANREWKDPKEEEKPDAKPSFRRPVSPSIDGNDGREEPGDGRAADEAMEKDEFQEQVGGEEKTETRGNLEPPEKEEKEEEKSKDAKSSRQRLVSIDGTSDRSTSQSMTNSQGAESVETEKDEKGSRRCSQRLKSGKPVTRYMDVKEEKRRVKSVKKIIDPINQPGDFNRQIEASEMYQLLRKKCKSRWNNKFTKLKSTDPDMNVKETTVDFEVFTRSGEGPKVWDAQWSKTGFATQGFPIHHVVACESRKLGEEIPDKVLIKYEGYPLPSWEDKEEIEHSFAEEAFEYRLFCLDFIEHRLTLQLGEATYLADYPNRYLQSEEGVGDGRYIQDERAIYFNQLRAIEARWNVICMRRGQPSLYIEDWTSDPPDAESLRALEFIVDLVAHPDVARIRDGFSELQHMRCEGSCKTCMYSKHDTRMKHCCGMQTAFDFSDGQAHFQWREKTGKCVPLPSYVHFECVDNCSCDPAKCQNRFIQKGRQVPLCIFRLKHKGWGVFTMCEIKEMDHIDEYAGEVCTEGLVDAKSIYNWSLPYSMGAHAPFVIVAGNKGNVSRYFNHACNGNMKSMTTVIERYGVGYAHMAFRAGRRIIAGEELTFNYFGEGAVPNMNTMFSNGCRCGHSKCFFPPEMAMKIVSVDLSESSGDEEENGDEKEKKDYRMADDNSPCSSATGAARVAMGRKIREKEKSRDAKEPSGSRSTQAEKIIGHLEAREKRSSTRADESMGNGGKRNRKAEGASLVRASTRNPAPSTSRPDQNPDGSSEEMTEGGDKAESNVSSPRAVKRRRFEEDEQ